MKNNQSSNTLHNQPSKPINKTLWLASLAVTSVLAAFIMSSISNIIDLQDIEQSQVLVDKKPIYHPISSEINTIDFRMPQGLSSSMKVTFQFNGLASSTNNVSASESPINTSAEITQKKQAMNEIKVEQVVGDDESEYRSKYFSNIDLSSINWKASGDTLIIDLSSSFDIEKSYYEEELLITIPTNNWIINTSANINNALKFESMGEPVNLQVTGKEARFVGNYANLTINQTAKCTDYSNQCFFILKSSKIDTLIVHSKFDVDLDEDRNQSSQVMLPFALTIEDNVQLNSAELYVPRESKIEMYDASLFNTIHWHPPQAVETVDKTIYGASPTTTSSTN